MEEKTCKTCGHTKLLETFAKRTKITYRNECKECYNLKKRKTPVKPKAKAGNKFCACCMLEKPLVEFNTRFIYGKHRPFSYCKTCERKRDSERYNHHCNVCGKEYKSGRKNNEICFDCHTELMKQNKVMYKYKERDFKGVKNPMYNVQRFGEKNPNYKHGISNNERYKKRLITGYGIWRKETYKRDDYTCQCCGKKSEGDIVAHHLDGYSWCVEKRTDVDNGITLCKSCHTDFHRVYGNFNNTKEQFEQFKLSFIQHLH